MIIQQNFLSFLASQIQQNQKSSKMKVFAVRINKVFQKVLSYFVNFVKNCDLIKPTFFGSNFMVTLGDFTKIWIQFYILITVDIIRHEQYWFTYQTALVHA